MKKLIISAAIAASFFAAPAISAMHAVLNCDGMAVSFDRNMSDRIQIQVGAHKYQKSINTSYDKTDDGEKLTIQSAGDEDGGVASIVFTDDDLARRKVVLVRNYPNGKVKGASCVIVGGQTW